MKLKYFLAALFMFSFLFCGFSRDTIQKIENIIQAYKQPYAGMAILVVKDGETVFHKGFGHANLELKTPVSADTRFNIGALARQITAMAIVHLVENNKLSLDEKISNILLFPEFGNEITVYHLLTHTSGLPSYLGLIDDARNTPVTNIEVLNLLKKYGKTDFEPGTQFRASPSDYAMLALVVEKISGMSFDRYLQRNIFRQIGIKDQVVAQPRMHRIKNRATGYIFRPEQGFIANDPGLNTTICGEAGIYLTLDEYMKIIVALNENLVLNEESRKLLLTPAKFNNGNEIFPQISLGLMMSRIAGVPFNFQSGPNNAFSSYVLILPETNVIIVLFSNQAGLFRMLDNIIYPIANLFTNDLFKDRIR